MLHPGETTLVFVHAIATPRIGGRNAFVAAMRRLGLSLYESWMLRCVRRIIESAPGPVVVVTDGHMLEVIAVRFAGSCECIRTSDHLRPQFQKFDRPRPMVQPLLDFVEALHSRFPGESGHRNAFVRDGVAHLEMFNLRWLVSLALRFAHAPLLHEIVEERPIGSFAFVGAPPELSVLVAAAAARGYRTSSAIRLASRLSGWLVYLDERAFFARIARVVFGNPDDTMRTPQLDPDRRRLLVIANYSRTLDRLLRELPRLAAAGWHVTILATRRADLAERVRDAGATVLYTDELTTQQEVAEAKVRGRRDGRTAWRAYRAAARAGLPQAAAGVSVASAAAPHIKAAMMGGFDASHLSLIVMARLLDALEPHLVLNFEDWELNRAASFLGRQRRIPTLAYYCLSGVPKDILFRRSQDWFAASGANLANGYRDQFPDGHVRIVGDTLVGKFEPATLAERRACAREAFGFSPSERIVVQLSTWAPASLADMRNAFIRAHEATRMLGNARFVVKAHPAESLSQLHGWLNDWGCSADVLQDVSLPDLCTAADLVTTVTTSAVFVPMSLGTPVVCLQAAEVLKPFEFLGFDFLKGKGVVHIPPEEDPVPTFRSLIEDPCVRAEQVQRGLAHAEEHLGPQDGRSAERLLAFMADIVEASKGLR
ncbi:MAG: hypothetical protein HC900_12695 [Methylacidiphilales bacterium]|nr:hypothetical protein [Candidatus Methylacidiphilales bacterium]